MLEHPTGYTLLIVVFFGVLVTFLGVRFRFFRLPSSQAWYPITYLPVLGAFATYIGVTVFYPIFIQSVLPFSSDQLGWLNLLYIGLVFALLLLYLACINRNVVRTIFGRFRLKSVGMGVLTWLISYPYVLIVGTLVMAITNWLWGKAVIEQPAVKHLKQMMEYPFVFALTLVGVIMIVPFLEELLFRGFLQSWMRRFLGRHGAIVVTALVFALVHYTPGQERGNIEIITSLFVLSYFLCFIYERESTLWAPIALHMTFNAVSCIAVIVSQ
ncbi:MAG: lysostaphin resistance A-like protein [Chlamydiales bacterium]